MRCTQSICPVPLWASPSPLSVSKYHSVPLSASPPSLVGGRDSACESKTNQKPKKSVAAAGISTANVTLLLFLMAVHVLQAVLREAEAVAHCHRVQVGAKREQVCMSGLQTSGGVQWRKCYL